MLLGIMSLEDKGSDNSEFFSPLHLSYAGYVRDVTPYVWSDRHVALCYLPSGIKTLDESPQPFTNKDGSIVLVFEGKIHNMKEIKQTGTVLTGIIR